MYFDLRFSHALKTEAMTTLDLRTEKDEPPKDFNVLVSLFNTLRYTAIDTVLISLMAWFFGASIFV